MTLILLLMEIGFALFISKQNLCQTALIPKRKTLTGNMFQIYFIFTILTTVSVQI